MRVAEIRMNLVAYIWEEDTDTLPIFPPYIDGSIPLLVDITKRPEVVENWLYDLDTQTFSEPLPNRDLIELLPLD